MRPSTVTAFPVLTTHTQSAHAHFTISTVIVMSLLLSGLIVGFQDVIHHVCQHCPDMAVGQIVQDVLALAPLPKQAGCSQQPEMMRYQGLAYANLAGQLADRARPVETGRD